jgi:hypothetical protein
LEKVGVVDYKLKLPDQYKIHPVFHMSLLTEYQSSHLIQCPPFECLTPEIVESDVEEYIVQEVLDSRRRYNQVEYLVLWKGYPRSEATWEKEGNLKNSPILIAEFHMTHPKAVKSKHRTSHMIPSIPVTPSHISPFTSPQGSPMPKARTIALPP